MGRNPVRQLDDEAMLQAKIDRGTYPALVGTSRISLNLMEPLRGMLADDPKLRWSLNDLDLWLSGRRLSPRQPQVPRKASRPFELAGTLILALPGAGAGLRPQYGRGGSADRQRRTGPLAEAQPGRRSAGGSCRDRRRFGGSGGAGRQFRGSAGRPGVSGARSGGTDPVQAEIGDGGRLRRGAGRRLRPQRRLSGAGGGDFRPVAELLGQHAAGVQGGACAAGPGFRRAAHPVGAAGIGLRDRAGAV